MKNSSASEVLESTGAVRSGHFLLSSGLHSPVYVQCALVLQYPEHAEQLSQEVAGKFRGERIDAVISPALGGVVWGQEVARQLGARAVFAERDGGGKLILRRGFSLAKGERVLVAEDVITTGGSTRETIEVARAEGAEVVGVAVLMDRSGGKADFGVRLESVVAGSMDARDPADCPQCRDGIPIEKPGSRPAA